MNFSPRSLPGGTLSENDLHAALACARIHAVYQPIMRLSDRRPVGIEALARLEHPEHGTVPMVKLDRNVVEDSATSEQARDFLAVAISAATEAGLLTTAEGVEDEACWNRMRDIGVDHAQGYLIARPLSHHAVDAWHRSWVSASFG
jgi:EAL domain-containing protein (putative c-di-GMP-specific phosphodiesterase class I)